MNALEVVQRQLDAWNRHDAKTLVSLYAKGATYYSPCFEYPLMGQTIADFVKSVSTAYPDLRFEMISSKDTGGGMVASQLVLHATHTGWFMDGTPPTGRTVSYPLASFVQVEGNKVRSEHVYLGWQPAAERLGLKAKAKAARGDTPLLP
jgi:steroid delta-isomerase-like uncharacterized protein